MSAKPGAATFVRRACQGVRRPVAVATVVLASAIVGAGCSSDSSDTRESAGPATPSTPASSPTPTKSPTRPAGKNANITPTSVSAAPVLVNGKGAIGDLSGQKCGTTRGSQTAEAVVTSSAKKPSRYLVTLSWTTAQGDVLARGSARVGALGPGASMPIKISTRVPAGAVLCVWGVERAAA